MLSTLIELQRLKRLDRTGWTLRGLPNGTESVAAHSFGVSVTAMLLADRCTARGVSLDVEKVLRIALLHDWAETRVGDMPRTAALTSALRRASRPRPPPSQTSSTQLTQTAHTQLFTTTTN